MAHYNSHASVHSLVRRTHPGLFWASRNKSTWQPPNEKASSMKKHTLILAATVLAVAGCSSPSEETPHPVPSTSSALSGSTTSTSPNSTSEESSIQAETSTSDQTRTPDPTVPDNARQEKDAPSAEPTVVECLDGSPGSARWSDGSVSYSQWCFDAQEEEQVLDDEHQPAPVDSKECVGSAAECGYGTADNGARNPTSGEIQTYHGCQDGYITDPALCSAVEEVVRAADPDGTIYN